VSSLLNLLAVAAAVLLTAASPALGSSHQVGVSSPTGTTRWPVDPTRNVPVCIAGGSQVVPKICSDEAGGAYIVWDDYRSGLGDVYVQRIAADGTPVWSPDGIPLAAGPGDQAQSAIAPDGSGGALIAWVLALPESSQVRVQRVNANGMVLWPVAGVTTRGNPLYDTPPALVADGAGGAYMAWTSYDEAIAAFRLVMQHVDHDGTPL
jgi:hypothetical protein